MPANSLEEMIKPAFSPSPTQVVGWISRTNQWRLLVLGLIANDIFMTGMAFLLAYVLRFNTSIPVFQLDATPAYSFYRNLSFALNPLWTAVFAANGLYQRRNLLGGTQEYALVFRASSLGMMLVIVTSFLQPEFVLARGWILLSWILAFLFVAIGRFSIRRAVYALRRRGLFLSRALIVGANEEGISLAQQLLAWRTSGLDVLGFVDDKVKPSTTVHRDLVSLGRIANLDQLIVKYGIEELIIATSALTRGEMLTIFKKYGLVGGLNLRLSSGLFEIITTGLELREMAYAPLVRVQKVRLTGLDRILKLLIDYAITVPGLIAITPLMLLIALAIRLDSPGPVIYRRRVMGINGRKFDAFKFRTMSMNSEEILASLPALKAELSENHKLKNDPRVTRVGRILRRASLDELPQLLNVLRREMSLVGPRMISPSEMQKYNAWGLNLLTVHPGITGLWQVSGRSDVSYEERVRMDMHYIRNWTIWLDIQILWQTIPAVLKARGAY